MNEDLKILANYCYNKNSKILLPKIWYSAIKNLIDKNKIKRIYEIYENDISGAWYYVVTTNNMRYIVKHKLNDILTKMMIQSLLLDKFECIRVNKNSLSDYLYCKDYSFYKEVVA